MTLVLDSILRSAGTDPAEAQVIRDALAINGSRNCPWPIPLQACGDYRRAAVI